VIEHLAYENALASRQSASTFDMFQRVDVSRLATKHEVGGAWSDDGLGLSAAFDRERATAGLP
jgi:hypothetical protein